MIRQTKRASLRLPLLKKKIHTFRKINQKLKIKILSIVAKLPSAHLPIKVTKMTLEDILTTYQMSWKLKLLMKFYSKIILILKIQMMMKSKKKTLTAIHQIKSKKFLKVNLQINNNRLDNHKYLHNKELYLLFLIQKTYKKNQINS